MKSYPTPPFEDQPQDRPGLSRRMDPVPDHGEDSYRGNGRLAGKRALITGGDSGIGRAIAIAFAREGADIVIGYLDEHEDAQETGRLVEEAGRQAVLCASDISHEGACRALVDKTCEELGGIDILINNAAYQSSIDDIAELSAEEWRHTFAVNIHGMFYLSRFAIGRMEPGGVIINTASINSDDPSPQLLAYATTKGAIQNFTAGLAQLVADKGIRVNAVAPGPVWTPLIPTTLPAEKVRNFGKQSPMKRPAQPAELAPAYVLLASDEASYMSGAVVAVTGGMPMI